ncbi:MAG: hypothetical protein Q7S52_02995 [bacterium]|nr:hypothetical protein [bacterium]
MTDDSKTGSEGDTPKECVVVSSEEFLRRLQKKYALVKHETLEESLQIMSRDVLFLTRHTSGMARLHEALLDVMLMQNEFIVQHVERNRLRKYLLRLDPLLKIHEQKMQELESLK